MEIQTKGQGLYEITDEVGAAVRRSGVPNGVCTLFLQHTSASLIIQENADPTAREDLERWLSRFVPEGDPLYRHTSEGADDMPAHIKAALTNSDLTIPVIEGRLALGTWQGIYLWEHRIGAHRRKILCSIVRAEHVG